MDSAAMFNQLAAELEQPRPVLDQVYRHLQSTYGIGRDEAAAFFAQPPSSLEDYEVDLILSPMFTPGLPDQARFATDLGARSLDSTFIGEWIESLARRPTIGHFLTDSGPAHRWPLRAVTIERYVRRLRLDGAIPEPIDRRLQKANLGSNRALALAVARRSTWTHAGRRQLLEHFLDRAPADGWTSADWTTLLRLAETYEPESAADFTARLPGWIDSVRAEASAAAAPKPFFNERVQDLHGGGRDQRARVDARAAERQLELATLQNFARVLA